MLANAGGHSNHIGDCLIGVAYSTRHLFTSVPIVIINHARQFCIQVEDHTLCSSTIFFSNTASCRAPMAPRLHSRAESATSVPTRPHKKLTRTRPSSGILLYKSTQGYNPSHHAFKSTYSTPLNANTQTPACAPCIRYIHVNDPTLPKNVSS